MITCCSKDARKVLDKYAGIDQFKVERMLYKGNVVTAMQLLKKHGTDDKAVEKITAMLDNGYCKNLNRNIGEIAWDKIMFHYYYLVQSYLVEDFPYNDILAINDMANFGLPFIQQCKDKLKVKNLWYLRKVLTTAFESGIKDSVTYRHISQVTDIKTDKGSKVEIDHLKGYVE